MPLTTPSDNLQDYESMKDKVARWADNFATNLAVNGAANIAGLKLEQLPIFRASARPLMQLGKKIIKQGINSSADKMKNTFYKEDEDEEKYRY